MTALQAPFANSADSIPGVSGAIYQMVQPSDTLLDYLIPCHLCSEISVRRHRGLHSWVSGAIYQMVQPSDTLLDYPIPTATYPPRYLCTDTEGLNTISSHG
ncbi:hypothetical protein CDAR_519631 [Caerostris darwini]|uniref:Uncharacterized protein n=1 Tax=Caerostris darwini TaxID=1538125 RepID=A0AAV4REE2_9ARAC|nr:hypothetical protein CDAR_519631 [Caerostris darwini]